MSDYPMYTLWKLFVFFSGIVENGDDIVPFHHELFAGGFLSF